MSGPTSGWEKVGDRFYRKIKLYDAVFDEDLELEYYTIVGAPYGGAIGMPLESLNSRKEMSSLILNSFIS